MVANGAGAAGIAIIKLLLSVGVQDVIMCDSRGTIYEGRPYGMNPIKESIARLTNRDRVRGSLADAIRGADVFIGVSVEGAVTKEMVASMNRDPIIFAMANPVPEIMPEDAYAVGPKHGRDGTIRFSNQVNNVLAFPGIFRGALDVRARGINEEMKIAAARAIAELIDEDELRPDYVIPRSFRSAGCAQRGRRGCQGGDGDGNGPHSGGCQGDLRADDADERTNSGGGSGAPSEPAQFPLKPPEKLKERFKNRSLQSSHIVAVDFANMLSCVRWLHVGRGCLSLRRNHDVDRDLRGARFENRGADQGAPDQ